MMDVVLLSELKCLMNNCVQSPSMDCLHLHSSVEKGKNSFFRVPSQKQGQLMCLLPQKTSWPCCMGGQAVPEAGHRAVNCKTSGAAPQEAEPSSAARAVRMDKELGSQQPL